MKKIISLGLAFVMVTLMALSGCGSGSTTKDSTPYGNNYDLLLSGAVMSIIPKLIVFFCNQKAFIEGLTVGGVRSN